MFDYLKNLKANYTVSAFLCVVIGLILVIWPGTSTQVVCMVLGGVLLAFGVLQILMYLLAKQKTFYQQGMLMLGVVIGVIGAWILLKPGMILAAVPVIIGIIIIMHGLHNAVQAIKLKGMNYGNWWVALLLGILTIVLGAILVYNPFKVIDTVVRVIGIFLIYNGISGVWISSRLFKFRGRDGMGNIIDADAVEVEDED